MIINNLAEISWRDLTGNKFNKSLHPVMLSENGFTRITKVRTINGVEPNYYKVRYDRDYVIAYLVCKFFKPLSETDRVKLFQILNEAYTLSKNRNTK